MTKKILLFSAIAEKTTNSVINWFLLFKFNFSRVSDQIIDIDIDIEFNLSMNNTYKGSCNSSEIKSNIVSFWYRKGQLQQHLNRKSNIISQQVQSYISQELITMSNYIIMKLCINRHLGNYFDREPNKLQHLWIAQEAGLSIPKTLVTQSKDKLLAFQQEVGLLITKSIKDFYSGVHDSVYYYNHTEQVTPEALADMPDTFFPTLVQEELQKTYELRVVFVCQKLYSMAIFSQNDAQTSVDWRNYNHKKPNRTVPYILPSSVEAAILRFIDKSGLNTGAIDMVVTTDKRYVFLECNPNGQISMVSENCNYPIEKDIALYLAYGTNPGTEA